MKFSLMFLVALALLASVNVNAGPVRNSNELNEVFQEFLALVPQDKVVKIFHEYLENDAEVQTVVKYVQSDSFKNLIKKVESIDDIINFYEYLHKSGVDIYDLVNKLHEIIGLVPLLPGGYSRNVEITGGVAGLIADVKDTLPIDEIKALYNEKLETSPAFAQLIERLGSPTFQKLIDALRANEEFQNIIKFAKEAGVDIDHIKDLIANIFGLKFPSRQTRATHDLHDDLQDFLALLPTDKITEIVLNYIESDPEVLEAFFYLRSDAFHKIVQDVENMKEAKDVLVFLEESGLHVYEFLNSIHKLLGLPPFKPSYFVNRSLPKVTGGIKGLIADIEAILPIDDIKTLYYQKLENSPAFANLVKRLSSQEFQDFVDAVLAKEEARVIINKLKNHGVDLQAITDLLSKILGLRFPIPALYVARSDLHDDLYDFIALLPTDDITVITMDYVQNDAQVQEAIQYMKSDAFHKIVEDVESMKEAKDVLAFLQDSGLDAYELLNTIHGLLGIPPFKPSYFTKRSLSQATGGIKGLIADIKAILPIDEIKALYYQKLENSPAFSNLIERLSSQEFQDFVDAVLAKEEARVIINKLKDHGVDLQAIADLLGTILGLHFPKPAMSRVSDELIEDLKDFMALVPLEEVFDIVADYGGNDADVQKAVLYISSEEFQNLASAAQQNEQFRNFLGYLDDSGLPASSFINKINHFLDIPEVHPSVVRRAVRAGGGVRGMLDAIEATLPREEIRALYEHKKKNSKAFNYLIERLEAPEFQTIVDELSQNKDFQNLGYRAASFGIDLEVIVDFLKTVFGINIPVELLPFSANSLEDDLKEFIALVPVKEIRRIVTRYVLFDREVKAAVTYVRSQEFIQLLNDLHNIPEYNDLLKSLELSGLDVYTYIKKIHKAIGFPSNLTPMNVRRTRGIAGMITEIKATIPVDDIKALYKKKLENSEEFAGLVKLISSDKFQVVVDALFANNIFQDIVHRLQSHGIDLQVVADFFLQIFGITTPPGIIDYRFWL